jgi:hypothetical protein
MKQPASCPNVSVELGRLAMLVTGFASRFELLPTKNTG